MPPSFRMAIHFLDKNNWVPILYTGKAIQKPYRVIFDITNIETVEIGRAHV